MRPLALAGAISRTATTREDAPRQLLDALQQSALIELETLLEDGTAFALKSHFQFLADTAGSQFAAKVGAGMAHLYMDALGYAWRANAACLSSSLNAHADFIYDGGNVAGHGVVLAEARGSFAKEATAAKITSAARRKYIKQVKPYIATASPFGKVIHGYSIAFGCKPTVVGSFLSVSETRISKPRKKADARQVTSEEARPEATPTAIALTTHRSNFTLMGASEIVDWIDWLRSADAIVPSRDSVEFIRLQYAGRTFLALVPWFQRSRVDPWWVEGFWDHPLWWRSFHHMRLRPSRPRETCPSWFAMEEKAASEFLNALSAMIRSRERVMPPSFSLPTFEPVGFGLSERDGTIGEAADEDYDYALFRDGLGVLGDPFRGRPRDIVIWSPDGGLLPG